MKKVRLDSICRPKQWPTISTDMLLGEGFPVYGANGKIGFYSQYNHENPTILITCRGATCGTINISEPMSYINGNAMCLDDLREDINIRFLYYQLLNYDFNEVISGSAQPQITREGLTKVYLITYTLAEQKEIADRLDKVVGLIEKRKEQLAKLDQLVKSRFIEMFGDPIANTNKKKLSEAGKIFTGSTPSMKEPSYYESHDIPFIKPSDLKEVGVTSIEGVEAYISKKARHVARVIPPNSVLVTCIGTIGKVGIATRESTCNQQINFIVPSENVNPVYLAYCLTFFKSILLTMANAPVVPIINKTQFSELEVPVFGIELQNQFAAFVEQVDKSKFEIQQSIDKLETLKKSLMQQYFG